MMKEKGFYKGVNLGGWFSQCNYSEERLNGYITQDDFQKIALWGVDHVRLPIDYNIIENDDGTYKEDGFARIGSAIDTAKKYGLNIVLDIHKTAGFSFDDYSEDEHGFFENESYRERFCRLWEQLSKRFGNCEGVAFELLNEVTDKAYIDVWNKTVKECIKRIRVNAPDTLILVGSYWNNSPQALADLDKPYDDKVVYNFHCYAPLKFTHQGAYWTSGIDQEARYTYEESGVSTELFEEEFSTAIEKANAEGVSLYCGEYGVIDRAEPANVLKWFKAINQVFEKYGIARAVWSYKEMDFGLSDKRMDEVREELVKYL